MTLLSSVRNKLRLRHRIERLWPKFVPLDGKAGVYTDRATRLWISANPQVYNRLNCFLAKIINPGASFIDCGANFGWVSIPVALRIKAAAKGGKVLAIEASPNTAKVLSRTVQRNRLHEQIILAQTFVAENAGSIEFYNCTAGGMSPQVSQKLPLVNGSFIV